MLGVEPSFPSVEKVKKAEPSEKGPEKSPVPPHLDVATQMKERNAYFVHVIQLDKTLDVSENNKVLDTKKLTVANKLDIIYGTQPTLSTSTLRPDTKDATFRGYMGVVFSQGEIESAHASDTGSKAVSLNERSIIGGVQNSEEDVKKAIEKVDPDCYNEIVLKKPVVCGGFLKLQNFANKIKHDEQVFNHYDGATEKVKYSVLDLSNPVFSNGRPTGEKYDGILDTLLEMEKRGRVFVLGTDNQMHIVTSINEKTRQVEFDERVISPEQMASSYTEKLNPYMAREMRDRLESEGVNLEGE